MDAAVDHTDEGEACGAVAATVSGNRQCARSPRRCATATACSRPACGYGRTTPWPPGRTQALDARAELVLALAERVAGR
jgi:hypothetical protein